MLHPTKHRGGIPIAGLLLYAYFVVSLGYSVYVRDDKKIRGKSCDLPLIRWFETLHSL